MRRSLFCAVFVLCWTFTSAANILLLIINHSSHLVYFGQLAKNLAEDGNSVTAVVGSGMTIRPEFMDKDITWLKYRMSQPPVTLSQQQVHDIVDSFIGNKSVLHTMSTLKKFFIAIGDECMELYDDESAMTKLEAARFDFAVVDASVLAFLYVPYRLDIPFATLSIEVDPFPLRAPFFPSYVPPLGSGFPDRMTFLQRTISVIGHSVGPPLVSFMSYMTDKGLAAGERSAPDKTPMLYKQLLYRASLYFTLRLPPVLHPVRGSIPNLIDIGGIMGRPANLSAISADMNAFISRSPQGFIMVSFGSWMDMLPDDIMDKFLETFAALKFNVLWKVGLSRVPDTKPDNIMFTKWLPQNDLLGHPMIRAFVTHCGISSMIETTFHGVPIVAFPLGIDQSPNAKLMAYRQFGIILDITTFSPEDFIHAVNNVTEEGNHYRASIQRASAILKDMPSAGKTASFWIRHVIKHGHAHLLSAAHDLTWYQYVCLDVMCFLLVAAFVGAKLMSLCCRMCCAKCCCRCNRTKHSKEKAA